MSRAKAVVVDAWSFGPVPAWNSANSSGDTAGIAGASWRRIGSGPFNSRRRAVRYWNSCELLPGCRYGGNSARSSSRRSRCRRSRNARSSVVVIFLTWCVALRASTELPSVQPLIVFVRITVGLPSCRTARSYAA